jgi:hypothetical protein
MNSGERMWKYMLKWKNWARNVQNYFLLKGSLKSFYNLSSEMLRVIDIRYYQMGTLIFAGYHEDKFTV